MTRDLGTDIDSVFSPRTGATLPKGEYCPSPFSLKINNKINTGIAQNEPSMQTVEHSFILVMFEIMNDHCYWTKTEAVNIYAIFL